MTINFSISKDIDTKQLEELYNDVGWSAYTQDLEIGRASCRERV